MKQGLSLIFRKVQIHSTVLTVLTTCFWGHTTAAQDVYKTESFSPDIHTILIHGTGSELSPPVINLNGNQQLVLRFDDLSDNVKDLYYEFEHCTYDWKSSELDKYDFQEGYENDQINDYELSFNTLIPYTNYRVEFPNDRIQITQSGNYIIRVFEDRDPEKVVLTARFMVSEPLAQIDTKVIPSRIVALRQYNQEVDMSIDVNKVGSLNPYQEIEVVVVQNYRWDNAKKNLKPSFTNGSKLMYDMPGTVSFDGTNEFRKLDAKSVQYRSEEVRDVQLLNDGYHIYMADDEPRAYQKYVFDADINGKTLIKNDDMVNAHTEADYVWVHFYFPVDAMFGAGDLYLFGQVSNWDLNNQTKLEYNADGSFYTLTKLLKQGYYNYQFLWDSNSQGSPNTLLTEGNHSVTENDYQVFVYFKDQRNFCHRLVGYKLFNSSGQ